MQTLYAIEILMVRQIVQNSSSSEDDEAVFLACVIFVTFGAIADFDAFDVFGP